MPAEYPVLLSCREALDKILAIPFEVPTEAAPLLEAGGRILAAAPSAPWDQPRFDNSSMDGFAVRCSDLAGATREDPVALPLAGESAAGRPLEGALYPGATARISTGAPMPEGADGVMPVELTSMRGDSVLFSQPAVPGRFIRRRGEDVPARAPLLGRGARLDPPALAFLAMYNLPTLQVFSRPRVAILTSGDEVRPHGASLGPADIVGVNVYYLLEELRAFGCEPRLFGISPDDPAAFCAMFEEALAWGDMVVTTAGVSVGEHDVVGAVVRDLGAEVLFWKVAVRPGKPMLVARFGKKPYFGLPGNPVSVCCNTEVFLKPFLRKALAIEPAEAPRERMVLAADCERDPRRLFFVFAHCSVRNGAWEAAPLPRQSSGNLHNPALANGLIVVEPGDAPLPAGTDVEVVRIVPGR